MTRTVSFADGQSIGQEDCVMVRTLDYDIAAWHTMAQPLAGQKNQRASLFRCNLPTVHEDEV